MLTTFKIAVLIGAGLLAVLFGVAAQTPKELGQAVLFVAETSKETAPAQKTLDPAAWGSNHVGKPVPDFVQGDECLFCHRNDIGPGWQKNTHGLAVRQSEDAPEWRDVFKG